MRALIVLLALAGVALADDAPKGFAPYPGARQLCNQHVSGNTMHIIWSSHATRDALAKVVTFYEGKLGKKASDHENGGKKIEVDANRHVTIYPVGSADKFPSCDSKSKSGEKTIVMLSTAVR